MILLCNLVKACLKFFNMRGYTDLMKFIVWARTMLFCEAITRPASRLLWNTAASRFLTSPDSASGHLKAQRQILNHNSQVTVLRQSFSKLQVYCMNSPRAALTHYSFTCKGKKKNLWSVRLTQKFPSLLMTHMWAAAVLVLLIDTRKSLTSPIPLSLHSRSTPFLTAPNMLWSPSTLFYRCYRGFTSDVPAL